MTKRKFHLSTSIETEFVTEKSVDDCILLLRGAMRYVVKDPQRRRWPNSELELQVNTQEISPDCHLFVIQWREGRGGRMHVEASGTVQSQEPITLVQYQTAIGRNTMILIWVFWVGLLPLTCCGLLSPLAWNDTIAAIAVSALCSWVVVLPLTMILFRSRKYVADLPKSILQSDHSP